MSDMRIDSHKLIYHIDRVHNWLKGKTVYPIYMEIAPTNACNHRCIFCGLDYRTQKIEFLRKKYLHRFLQGAARKGLKAVMFAGEGEPLLNKDMADFITFTKKLGVDVAVTTNGVFMDKRFCEKTLNLLSWIRISIDAGRPSTYARLHKTRKLDFDTVIENMKTAVSIKKKHKLPVTIGAQFLLLEENSGDVETLARLLKRIGADYLIIKPYSKHPLSKNEAGTSVNYSKFLYLDKRLKRYSKGRFTIIVRRATMDRRFRQKPYKRCLGTQFWAYVSADGNVYPCSTFYGRKRFVLGNIRNAGFTKIWNGKRRKELSKYIETRMDAEKCRELCRLDEINAYLWRLKHPHFHENFI